MFRTSLLAVFLIGLSAAAQIQPNSEVKFVADTLIVQAEGSYVTDPDLATLTFDVSNHEKQLKEHRVRAIAFGIPHSQFKSWNTDCHGSDG